ncbi:hypothetical protein ACFQX6_09755 [Streptosporangium lutulentum]
MQQNAAIGAYIRWRNARAQPKTSFAASSTIRSWTNQLPGQGCVTGHSPARSPSTPTPGPLVAAVMTTLFDQLAPTWDAEHATNRLDALTDALERGGTLPTGICLEVGSGTGRTLLPWPVRSRR